jgi:bacterioferritin-associated ferredoxin
MTLSEARRVTADDLARGFGGPIPDRAARAAHLWVEALGAALGAGLEEALGAQQALGDDRGILVCRCLAVGDRTIRRAVGAGARDVPAIGDACAAGTGCHSCWPDLRALLDEESDDSVVTERPDREPLSRIVDALVRPLWRAQGLALGGASVSEDVVRLRVGGARPDALASPIGALAMARHLLREVLGDGVRVELEDPAVAF